MTYARGYVEFAFFAARSLKWRILKRVLQAALYAQGGQVFQVPPSLPGRSRRAAGRVPAAAPHAPHPFTLPPRPAASPPTCRHPPPPAARAGVVTPLPVAFHAPLAPRNGAGPFPLVIFSPGAAANRNTYSAICAELASRGCVVAAIEHADGSSVRRARPRRAQRRAARQPAPAPRAALPQRLLPPLARPRPTRLPPLFPRLPPGRRAPG
jgi:hypothetical protein